MESKAILILENIWWNLDEQNRNQTSVLPFFEGLARLNEDIQIYYMTFTGAKDFDVALKHLLTAKQDRLFIYVASHGYGARLGGINFTSISKIINLAVYENDSKKVEGVIFGACEIGGVQNISALEALHFKTGIAWVLAYKNIMHWIPSTLIDLHFMNHMMGMNINRLKKRDDIVDEAVSALKLFNADEKIGLSRAAYENGASADIIMKDAIRFLVNPRGSGNIYGDETTTVQNRL